MKQSSESFIKSKLNWLRKTDHELAAMPKSANRTRLRDIIGSELAKLYQIQVASAERPSDCATSHTGSSCFGHKRALSKTDNSPGGDELVETGPLLFYNSRPKPVHQSGRNRKLLGL